MIDTTRAPAPRLHALARVLVFWIAYYAVITAFGMLKQMAPPTYRELAWGLASAAVLFPFTRFLLRREGRSPDEVGVRVTSSSPARFALGVVIGLGLYGIYLFAIRTIAGGLTFTRVESTGTSAVVLMACTCLALSAMEELGYRGYALRTLVPSIGVWPAQLLMAAAFALNHLFYGWSWIAVLLGVTTGALLFGMAALASGGLALPIGLHAAWNLGAWAMGEKSANGLWRLSVDPYALDRVAVVGSSCYVVTMLAGTAAFWLWYRRRQRALAP